MSKEDRGEALTLARQTLGFPADGRPVPDAAETAVRLARLVAALCRHAEATELLAAKAEAVASG
jgi:hypothetical protein